MTSLLRHSMFILFVHCVWIICTVFFTLFGANRYIQCFIDRRISEWRRHLAYVISNKSHIEKYKFARSG